MSADEVPAVPAASLILVRDAPELQVLMGERPLAAKAFPGALVFPGGKLEPQDADPAWAARLGVEAEADTDQDMLALKLAAIRETFEEAGVLLARDAAGSAVDGAAGPIVQAREAVAGGELTLLALMHRLGLKPDVAALIPFARWITPLGAPYRFDTWFFIAAAPPRIAAPVPSREFVSLRWMEVQALASQGRSGERSMLFPTRANLGLLAESASAETAMAAARLRAVKPVMPEPQQRDGRTVMTIRADAGYSVVQDPRTDAR
jgi:8-oxo-dGTP pyrophosphatase MutT (NUDIX family)